MFPFARDTSGYGPACQDTKAEPDSGVNAFRPQIPAFAKVGRTFVSMKRRDFVFRALATGGGFLLFGCGRDEESSLARGLLKEGTVTLYDTHAQALYMDGGMGPKTGIIKVDYILANQPVVLEFWHGHGGRNHRFTLTEAHYTELKKLKRVYIETTVVDGHTHKLFIDPVDPRWRVAGAKPVVVPLP
jgi:hypothetical protein